VHSLGSVPSKSLAGIASSVIVSLMRTVTNGGLSTFLVAQRWRESNPDAPQAAFESILESVRLEGVSTADLASIVRPSGLIPMAKLRALYDDRLKVQELVGAQQTAS